eukprot:2373442-Rhodomonas_salina.3
MGCAGACLEIIKASFSFRACNGALKTRDLWPGTSRGATRAQSHTGRERESALQGRRVADTDAQAACVTELGEIKHKKAQSPYSLYQDVVSYCLISRRLLPAEAGTSAPGCTAKSNLRNHTPGEGRKRSKLRPRSTFSPLLTPHSSFSSSSLLTPDS